MHCQRFRSTCQVMLFLASWHNIESTGAPMILQVYFFCLYNITWKQDWFFCREGTREWTGLYCRTQHHPMREQMRGQHFRNTCREMLFLASWHHIERNRLGGDDIASLFFSLCNITWKQDWFLQGRDQGVDRTLLQDTTSANERTDAHSALT